MTELTALERAQTKRIFFNQVVALILSEGGFDEHGTCIINDNSFYYAELKNTDKGLTVQFVVYGHSEYKATARDDNWHGTFISHSLYNL